MRSQCSFYGWEISFIVKSREKCLEYRTASMEPAILKIILKILLWLKRWSKRKSFSEKILTQVFCDSSFARNQTRIMWIKAFLKIETLVTEHHGLLTSHPAFKDFYLTYRNTRNQSIEDWHALLPIVLYPIHHSGIIVMMLVEKIISLQLPL